MPPRWHRGFETAVRNPVARDAFRFGLYTGMRRAEACGLEWARVDMAAMTFRVDDTKSGAPLELPVTRQLAAILERRLAERERFPATTRGWVFPSDGQWHSDKFSLRSDKESPRASGVCRKPGAFSRGLS